MGHVQEGLRGNTVGCCEDFSYNMYLLGRVNGHLFMKESQNHGRPQMLDCEGDGFGQAEGIQLMATALYHELGWT